MLFLLFSLLASAAAFTDYTPETYPDSLRQPALCGIQEPGYVCDPTAVLQNGTQLKLIHQLVNIQSQTKCICDQVADNSKGRCDSSGLGYIMSVAFTQQMRLNDDEKDRDTVLRAAEVFADKVRIRQNRGHCQDDLLIFVSVGDNVVWTSIGDNTKQFITNEMMTSISTHAEEFFFKSSKYYEGISYMLETYSKVLNGEKVKVTETKGWYWPLPLWAVIVIFVVVGLIILAVTGLGIYCCAKHCCCNDGRGRYAMPSSTSRL